jgi:L-aminopeptidase/D-esterase-like protein
MDGSIVDVPGVRAGHAGDPAARTGCTVILFDDAGAVCGVDVRGSAPGTRETDLLAPVASAQTVHAILLAGGSAFGLDAAGGVMAELEARGVGYAVGPFRVPIVPAAVIFDLFAGAGSRRPDRAMGIEAVRAASGVPPAEGRVGVGAGATVAKLGGLERARPGGVGTASLRHGDVVVGALAVCNAVGNVYDFETGELVAAPSGEGSFDVRAALAQPPPVVPGANTTLAVVATNAGLSKAGAQKVAQMAHDGLARAVVPAHLTLDGDTIFACSAGRVVAPLDLIGVLAADAVARAIVRGVRAGASAARTAPGA